MDLHRIIKELDQERERLTRIIESLEGITPSGKAPPRPGSKRRGRKSMDEAARKEVSERMKLYWEGRRKEKENQGREEKDEDKETGATA
jgi:hypothetical protein